MIDVKLSAVVHSRQNSKSLGGIAVLQNCRITDRRRSTSSPVSLARTILHSSRDIRRDASPRTFVPIEGLAKRGSGGEGGDNDDNRGWVVRGWRADRAQQVARIRLSRIRQRHETTAMVPRRRSRAREKDYATEIYYRHTDKGVEKRTNHSRDEGTTDRETLSRCVRRRSPTRECEDCARLRETAREGRRPLPPQRSTKMTDEGRGRPSDAPRRAANRRLPPRPARSTHIFLMQTIVNRHFNSYLQIK